MQVNIQTMKTQGRKSLVDKLVERSSAEECTGNIDEVKIANENECVYSYTICVVLAVIALAVSIGIGAYFVYSRWYLKNITRVKFDTRIQWNCIFQTTI